MGRKKPSKSLLQQVKERLDSKLAIGESKAIAKRNGTYTEHIYSWKTYRTYLSESIRFVQWCKEQPPHHSIGHKPRTLEECGFYVEDYLKFNIERNLSPWTLHTQANSIAKLMGCSTNDFNIKLPIRKRGGITRSRGSKIRDKNYSEANNREIINFNRCVGLRRSELAQIRGSDLIYIDGRTYLKVVRGTKGGKKRLVEVVSTDEEMADIVKLCKSIGDNKLFPHPNTNIDFHELRRDYAKRLYSKYASKDEDYRNTRLLIYKHKILGSYTTKNGRKSLAQFNRICKELNISPTTKDLYDISGAYYCRNDLKGHAYSRRVLYIVSQNLGHNRSDVSIFYVY